MKKRKYVRKIRWGVGKSSILKVYRFIDEGRGKTTIQIAEFMGIEVRRVHPLIHRLRQTGRKIWTVRNARGEWVYKTHNISPEEAQFHTERVIKFSVGVVRNNADTLKESRRIAGDVIKDMLISAGKEIQGITNGNQLAITQQENEK